MSFPDPIHEDRDFQLGSLDDDVNLSRNSTPLPHPEGSDYPLLPSMSTTNTDLPVVWQQGSGPQLNVQSRRKAHGDCTHSTVVRVHDDNFVCPNCLYEPGEGYVYRCVEDLELRLNNAIFEDSFVAWDEHGEELAKLVKPPARGPDRRATADRETILAEMTPEQRASYTEEQIEKLVSQRNQVLMIAKDSAVQAGNSSDKPWVLSPRQECDMEFCHMCRPYFAEKSYLSLNGILNGDVPATAALGFGFHAYCSRPLYNPDIARNLGLRRPPGPFPTSHMQFNLMELIESHLNQPTAHPTSLQSLDFRLNQVMGSPPGSITDENQESTFSCFFGCKMVRPPWTPPPTPPLVEYNDQGEAFGSIVVPHDGRSSLSIRDSSFVRQQVFQTVPEGIAHSPADYTSEKIPSNMPARFFRQDQLKCLTEEACNVGLGLPFSQCEHDSACSTMLPSPDFEEMSWLKDGDIRGSSTLFVENMDHTRELRSKTEMERSEEAEGHFGEKPLKVLDGIALTEEAVQTGTPDIRM